MTVDEIEKVVKEYKEKKIEEEDSESEESDEDRSISEISSDSEYDSEMASIEEEDMESEDEDEQKKIDESGYKDINVEKESLENNSQKCVEKRKRKITEDYIEEIERVRYQNVLLIGHLEQAEDDEGRYKENIRTLEEIV